MNPTRTNIAASIRQRLSNLATKRNEDFEQVLVRYALERLLYRLSVSPYADRFVLKGALLFRLWFDLEQRPTRDADFLGFGSAEPDTIAAIFRELAAAEVRPDDGLAFDTDSVVAVEIRKPAGYPGVRVSLKVELAKARIPVQCDIGFGDAVTPDPLHADYPTLLDLPAPRLRVYPLETVIAEKLEAIVKLGAFNSRLKDYFDLWVLMRYDGIDAARAVEAVRATFERRGTDLPVGPLAGLTDEFGQRQQVAWNSFLRRGELKAPGLPDVLTALRGYAARLIKSAEREASSS